MSDEQMIYLHLAGHNCSWDRLAWLVDLPASPTAWPAGTSGRGPEVSCPTESEFGAHVTEAHMKLSSKEAQDLAFRRDYLLSHPLSPH